MKLYTKVDCTRNSLSEENCKNLSVPIFITVQFGTQFLSWNLPYVSLFDDSLVLYEVNQNLCLIKEDPDIDLVDIAIEVKAPRCGKYHRVLIKPSTKSYIAMPSGKLTK